MVMRYNGIEIDRSALTIRHRERFYHPWSPTKLMRFKVFEALIMGGGMSVAQLFWMIYGNDPDGGPLGGPEIFKVRFWQWRKHFDALDLELHRVKIAGVIFFSLVPKHRF